LDCPLLIFHSPADEVVGIDHASRIFRAARHPKNFVSEAGALLAFLSRRVFATDRDRPLVAGDCPRIETPSTPARTGNRQTCRVAGAVSTLEQLAPILNRGSVGGVER
jgi:fermentation-respiration switch protein FrsA (DUF1100 family)